MKRVGIEAMAVAVPQRYLDLEDLARARGVDPAKYTAGLGAKQMAVSDPGEDAVALATSAAARLIRSFEVDVTRLGMLVVGTESGVDHSKPVASFVQGLLDLPRSMRTYDTQHACYGGTAALMATSEWIASGAADGRKALVICSDLARYGVNTAGEPTQGGAAVAMLVSADPKLLELDVGLSGVSSAHVHDFWRPHGRREALVDGHYSIQCYLDALSGAYRGWRERALAKEVVRRGMDAPSAQLARIAYHVPFCKMARKAHAAVRACDAVDGFFTSNEAEDLQSFDLQVAPSLPVCARVGNAYTASLYLGLAGLLDAQAHALTGKRVGLFSYGSGCCGEFFSGVVGHNAEETIRMAGISDSLEKRERISVEEYERIMSLPHDALPALSGPPGTFRLTAIKDNRRHYAEAR